MIQQFSDTDLITYLPAMAHLLKDCVHDGASIGFVLPFSTKDATRFWQEDIAPQVEGDDRILFAWVEQNQVIATISLLVSMPANQPHRAEVSKLMVHPNARRSGIARALLDAVEREARARGKTLLTLDTRTGDSAEPLYLSIGYQIAGTIPGYCMDVTRTQFDSTTYMFKPL